MKRYLYLLLFISIQFLLAFSKEENKTDEVQGRHFGFGGFGGNPFGFRRRHHRIRYNNDYDYWPGFRGPRYNRYGNFPQNQRIIFEEDNGRPFKPDELVQPTKPTVSRKEPLFSPNCGEAKEYHTSRIVGGRLAGDNEFPWQVSIQVNHLPTLHGEFTQYCGGAILNERWVVTAAHCMTGVTVASMKGIVGANDINDLEPGASEIIFDKAIVHEKYNEKITQHRYDNDIALLHTKTRMSFKPDQKINSICLPKKEDALALRSAVSVSGWGRTAEGGSKSEKLRTVDFTMLDNKFCQDTFKTLFNPTYMICAGDLKGGKDSCQADSGGPLINSKENKSYLVGIVSFGIGCARKGKPGSYTKVSNYVDWITKKIRENSR